MTESGAQNSVGANQPPSREACTWAMLCHIFGLGWMAVPVIGGIIGSLIIWQIKKDQHPFVDRHGKEALNFQISMLIYGTALLFLVCIGWVVLPLVVIGDVVFAIIAAVKAGQGEAYRYPLSIRFIK